MLAETIENRLFVEIQLGETAQLTRTVTAEDIDHYAAASGDFNPSHVDQAYTEERQMGRRVAHSLWGASLFSSLLGNRADSLRVKLASCAMGKRVAYFRRHQGALPS